MSKTLQVKMRGYGGIQIQLEMLKGLHLWRNDGQSKTRKKHVFIQGRLSKRTPGFAQGFASKSRALRDAWCSFLWLVPFNQFQGSLRFNLAVADPTTRNHGTIISCVSALHLNKVAKVFLVSSPAARARRNTIGKFESRNPKSKCYATVQNEANQNVPNQPRVIHIRFPM